MIKQPATNSNTQENMEYTSVEIEGYSDGVVKIRYLDLNGVETVKNGYIYDYSVGGHTIIQCQPNSVGILSVSTNGGLVLLEREVFVKSLIRDRVLHLEICLTKSDQGPEPAV